MAPQKVTIVGSGNWGSAIARILGRTVKTFPDEFDSRVVMWVYEEVVDGKKLSEVINNEHENIKYLPGKKLPENVVAVTDLVESCKEADVLVFVVPHQHVEKLCGVLKGNVKKDAIAISLIKGLGEKKGSGMCLVSQQIRDILGIDVAVLMGANLAPEVADDNFCEATIGIRKKGDRADKLKKLFHTDNFRINVVEDADTVELCGALKFAELWSPGTKLDTFFESCGVADLVTTCYGGRNRKICEAFVKTKKPIPELEKELLNGQSAQGPLTAYEVYQTLTEKKKLDDFPLFVAVHKICKGELPPEKLIDNIRDHPKYAHI